MADPGFPRGGRRQLSRGAPTYDFAKFPKNCMNLKKFGPPGGAHPSRSLRSATDLYWSIMMLSSLETSPNVTTETSAPFTHLRSHVAVPLQGMCSFSWICVARTLSFFEFTWKMSKFQENEYIRGPVWDYWYPSFLMHPVDLYTYKSGSWTNTRGNYMK